MTLRTVLTSNTFEQQRQTINLIGSDLDTLATGFNSNVLAALSPSNTTVTISPTGTGSVTINPETAGTINNMSIGATTKASGAFTTLEVRDTTTVAQDLVFASNSSVALTADRTLTFDVTNANRTIKLAGNIDIANNFTTSGNFAVTITSTAATNVTLPTTGTLATTAGTLSSSTTSTQDGYFGNIALFDDSTPSHYLTVTNSANLTAARTLSVNVNDADRTISLSGNLTLANNLTTSGNFALTLTTTAATTATLPSGTVTLLATNGSGSSLTFGTGTLSLAGNLTTSGAFATTLTVSAATNVTLPTSGTLLASGGALGTPSSGTLTNCSGLPVSGITASTSSALGVGSIELGNASDTTISRSAAGRIAVEGNDVAHRNDTTFVGTTSVALNRATGVLALTGISSVTGDTGTSTLTLQTAATAVASTASGAVTIQSGNATGTSSNSGNITIDVGTATAIKGSISIGPTNATAVNLPTGKTKIGNTTLTQSAVTASITFPQFDVVLSPLPYMVRISATRNKTTNNTSAEAVFDAANDTIGLYLDTLYYFKGFYYITTAASTTAHQVQIGFNFTESNFVDFWFQYNWQSGTSSSTTQNTGYSTSNFTLSNTIGVSQTNSQQILVNFEGWVKSAGAPALNGGTLTPVFTQTVAGTSAAPQIMLGSWFSLQPMVSGSPNIISGTWT